MRTPNPRLILIAVTAALAACATVPRSKPQPAAPKPAPFAAQLDSALRDLAAAPPLAAPALPAVGGLSAMCVGYAMHATLSVPAGATDEVRQKAYFEDYVHAFLDARGQREYVACLEKDTHSDDYAKYHADAVKWLSRAQGDVEKYQAFFPADKRIVGAEETFGDVDAKTGVDHVAVSLRDGSKVSSDHTFPKSMP
ncbi:MAG: hypothetical protein ACHQ2Z_00475 [Elusimicrobiota bacterium]